MYEVSDEYLSAMTGPVHEWNVTGEGTKTGGGAFSLSENDIVQNSVSISCQCCSDEKIDIGQCYIGEMSMNVRKEGLTAADLDGASMRLFFNRHIGGSWGGFVMPVFTGDTTLGKLSASRESSESPAYYAFDGTYDTEWRSEGEYGYLSWDAGMRMRIRSVRLRNASVTAGFAVLSASDGALKDSAGSIITTSDEGEDHDICRTVNVYTDSGKATLIGSAVFDDDSQSEVIITPAKPAESYGIYLDFPDSYGYGIGLSEVSISADIYSDDAWGKVPMGEWNVETALEESGRVSLTCYDNMKKLDETFGDISDIKGLLSTSAFTAIKRIIGACGLTLQNTKSEVLSLPNGKRAQLSKCKGDNDWKTYRDILASAVSTLGAYASAGREGRIVLRAYKSAPLMTLGRSSYMSEGSSFAAGGHKIRAVRMSLKNGKTYKAKNSNWGVTGVTLDLGSNPFFHWQKIDTEKSYADDIAGFYSDLCYSAFSADTLSDPAFDLGDVFSFEGKSGLLYCMTKFTFDGHKYHMEGAVPVRLESTSSEVTGTGNSAAGSSGKGSDSSSGSYLYRDGSNMEEAFDASPASFTVAGNICFPDVYARTSEEDP